MGLMKETGANIYISWKDYSAICAALAEMEGNCEGADDDYVQNVQKDIDGLRSIQRKFKRAKYLKDKKI